MSLQKTDKKLVGDKKKIWTEGGKREDMMGSIFMFLDYIY